MKRWAVVFSLVLGLGLSGCMATQQAALRSKAEQLGLLRETLRDGAYDNNSFLVDPTSMRLEDVAASVYSLKTVTTFRIAEGELQTSTQYGVGISLDGGYLLTVEHVVSQSAISIRTPFGTVVIPAEKLSEQTYVIYEGKEYLLQRLYAEEREDIALFAAPASLRLRTFPYPIGNSDELRVGNYVYLVGNPLNVGINVREGIVSSLKVPEVVSAADVVTANAFMVSNGLNPGDSGAPVLGIRDGVYELVGLSQGTFVVSQRMGWVIRINTFVNRLAAQVDLRHPIGRLRLAQDL